MANEGGSVRTRPIKSAGDTPVTDSRPGDDALLGSLGTGEDICRKCKGTGRNERASRQRKAILSRLRPLRVCSTAMCLGIDVRELGAQQKYL